MIHTLIFDLGNVLLFFDYEKMLSQIAACCNLDPILVKKIIFDETLSHSYERGEITSRDLYNLLQSHCDQAIDYKKMMHAGSAIFEPNRLLISKLPLFKEQGMRLVLLSNTCDMHIDYVLVNYSFLNHFDELILSYKVGARKPEAKIYNIALNAAQCPKEACLFIDDVKENIEGARSVGIPGHHFIDTKQFLEHLGKVKQHTHNV